MTKQPHEMTFAEFVDAVQPSGGMNRWPQRGAGKEVQSYTVFLSGPAAEHLPRSLRDQEFRDATLEALTEKLGLNPRSFRDNVRVAEIVAVRHAYMSNALEASCLQRLTPAVDAEYALLSDFLTHPLIRQQVAEQIELSTALTPAMAAARAKLGADITERAAGGASRGAIVARNDQFTVQDIGGGQVVAHENRRLEELPEVGEDVTVTYYKGKGQVVVMRGQEVSPPFIDVRSGDVAVLLSSPNTTAVQMLLFNSMSTVAEFAEVHGLPKTFVREAMAAREATPKPELAAPAREPAGAAYLDVATGSVALNYREGGATYTAVFHSAEALATHAQAFSATDIHVEQAREIERQNAGRDRVQEELKELRSLVARDLDFQKPNADRGRYAGPVVAESRLHVLQDVGRNTVVYHDKRDLDKLPQLGGRMTVAYKDGRGAVDVRQAEKGRSAGRD